MPAQKKRKPVQQKFDLFEDESNSSLDASSQDGNANPTSLSDSQLEQILKSILSLSTLEGIGFKTICNAYDNGFLMDIWLEENDLSSHPFVLKTKSDALSAFAKDAKRQAEERSRSPLQLLKENRIEFTAQRHKTYPQSFSRLSEPPRWLFVQGDKDVLHSHEAVALIGTRTATFEGIELAKDIAGSLARYNVVVLSGMARGIDEAAHQGCVDHYGLTIAVLGEGILFHRMSKAVSRIREIILDRGSVIVSEYLPDDPPSNQSFLRRNGLIVALSQAVIPIEFPKRQSGTGSSILHAKKLGVPVIGVLPKHLKTKSMISTKENFAAESIPLNTIHRTLDFHIPDILREILPGHLWYNDPAIRQNRYFSTVANRTVQVSGRLSLTEDSIDVMAEIIKQRLREAMKG